MATMVASKETGNLLQELKSENSALRFKIEKLEAELEDAKITISQLDFLCDSFQFQLEHT